MCLLKSRTMADATEELSFSFYLVLRNLNLSKCIWLVANGEHSCRVRAGTGFY